MVIYSTTDIVNALVAKGVLTEEEGALLTKGRTDEAAGQAKALKKAGKLTVSDAIDNATVYGDIRVRYEDRSGKGVAAATGIDQTQNLGRSRYKMTLGVKTTSGDFFSDLAFAMGGKGRSDNADFGGNGSNAANSKDALYVKRASLGWNATDWLTLQAGRMENPLYTTPMVWDADLTTEGLAEKFKFKAGDADIFLTALQHQYKGIRNVINDVPQAVSGAGTGTTELFAFQGGARYAINDKTSAKAALTYTTYSKTPGTNFAITTNKVTNTLSIVNGYGVNDLNTIEIPAEINYMASSNIGVRVFGDYVNNTTGDDRAKAAGIVAGSSGSDDTAWMFGVAVGSAKDLKAFEGNKMVKGDWAARVWYQDVGAFSVDANLVDSDFMDSRVNMKGTTFKAQYNIQDNVYANFAYGHATRKNGAYNAAGIGGDLGLNLSSFDLAQFDITYKF